MDLCNYIKSFFPENSSSDLHFIVRMAYHSCACRLSFWIDQSDRHPSEYSTRTAHESGTDIGFGRDGYQLPWTHFHGESTDQNVRVADGFLSGCSGDRLEGRGRALGAAIDTFDRSVRVLSPDDCHVLFHSCKITIHDQMLPLESSISLDF